jgi:predicted O-linked N-acetylglucosamine transferase (SPINDLY family)
MSLSVDPDPTLEQVLEVASDHHAAGRLQEALEAYSHVLARCPDHVTALHRRGILAFQTGQLPAATAFLSRAVALEPSAWRSQCSLGLVFSAMSQFQEAVEAFQKTLLSNPDCLEAIQGAGAAFRALGRGPEAIEAFRRALALRPADPKAHSDLGVVLQDAGQVAGAIGSFRKALELCDEDPVTHSNLGNALLAAGQVEEALTVLRAATLRWPTHPDAWYNLGNAAFTAMRLPEAVASYRQALALSPTHLAAYNNLGNALQAQGLYEEALGVYRQAMAISPDFADTLINASAAARALGRHDEAIELLMLALEKHPRHPVIHCNLGNLFKDVGLMEEAINSFRQAVELDPGDIVSHSNLAYAVCFLPGCDSKAILEENLRWDRMQARPEGRQAHHTNDPDPDRRLRIGYVSPNFREHCQAHFTIPLFANHDRSRFETFCYAQVPTPDSVTERIRGCVDAWRDIAGVSDAAVATQIQADGIDILVDLTMHMSNGRPLLFDRKPAPVQVAWLAYPGTTGLSAMDFRLTDPFLDPPGTHEDWYSETTIRLPDTFWCYDPLTTTPMPGPLPVHKNGHITFGSLNNFCKVTPQAVKAWARVLQGVPRSRLLLLAPRTRFRQRVLDLMAESGISGDRIEFAAPRPRLDYLALYQRVDLGLDTFPYNGHTTSLDSFWMGVPVVTYVGDTVVGRAGWSLLSNLGMCDLAAETLEDFVQIAVDQTRDIPRLEQLRAGLRDRMEHSPLMDGERFSRNVEAAFRQLWQQWCSRGTA